MYTSLSRSHTFRMFFAIFTAVTMSAMLVTDVAAAKDEGEKVVEYEYVQWPTLPPGMEMTGANGIDIDSQGRLYAAAGEKQPILVFSTDGKLLDAWGEGVIESKHIVHVYNDKVYVCDTALHQVFEFTPDGKLLRAFGTKGKAGTEPGLFNKPTSIAPAANGDFYVTDGYGNRRIVCLDSNGKFKFAWGKEGTGPGEFKDPHDIVIPKDQKIYIADRENHRIQIFDLKGKFLGQWTNVGRPFGLKLVPGEPEKLLVTDGTLDGPQRVLIMDFNGNILSTFGSKGKGPGQFEIPHSVTIDSDGNLYVSEVENKRISKFVKKP